MKKSLILAVALALGAALNASAGFINIVVDEGGHGYVGLPDGQTVFGALGYSTSVADPYATAHPSNDQYGQPVGVPLSYALDASWTITPGDLRFDDVTGGQRSDLIRITTGNPRLYFYSDKDDPGPLALADVGVPLQIQNFNVVVERGMDTMHPSGLSISSGANGYQISVSNPQTPGFITGSINGYQITGVNYYFISDGEIIVPEPTTMIAGALLLLPFGASALRILRRK